MKRVVAVSERETACLMVGCDDNKRLLRVRFVELIGNAHGFIHVPSLAERRCCIVAVAGVVDHSALHHHEELLIPIVEEGDCRADDLREGQVSVLAVDGVRQVIAVLGSLVVGLLHQDQFLHLRFGRHSALRHVAG